VLNIAFWTLTAAIILGMYLSLFYLELLRRRSLALGIVHALVAVASLIILFFALKGPVRGIHTGTQSFGEFSLIVGGIAFIVGLTFYLRQRFFRKTTFWIVGAHVTLGIVAYVYLLAYVVMG
jgi:hypothetical protein